MVPRKSTGKKSTVSAASTPAGNTVQLWHGEGAQVMALELKAWREKFSVKYPSGKIVSVTYDEDQAAELAAEIRQAAWGGGLFAQKTFTILTGFLAAPAKSDLAETLRKLIHEQPADAVALLLEPGKMAWSRGFAKECKAIADEGGLVMREFLSPTQADAERLALSMAQEQGGSFAPGAARILANEAGSDLVRLKNEVDKLVAYRGAEPIRAADIDELVAKTVADDVFAFVDAVGRRDFSAATQALDSQFSLGTSPHNLVGMLAWQVRVLALVRSALDSGAKPGPSALAAELGLKPYVVTKALQQMPYYPADRLAWVMGELSSLDVALKSRPTDPKVLFASFLAKVAGLKPGIS